jgi:hypothetical protein
MKIFNYVFFPFMGVSSLFLGTHYGLAYLLPLLLSVPLIAVLHLLITVILLMAGTVFTIHSVRMWREK